MIALLLGGTVAYAQEYSSRVGVSNLQINLEGDEVVMDMDLDFSMVDAQFTETKKYSLEIVSGSNYVIIPVATLLGRTWFYHYARQSRSNEPFTAEECTWYYKDAPKPFHFVCSTPYREWLGEASLRINVEEGGCCGKEGELKNGAFIRSAHFPVPEPEPEVPSKPVFRPKYIYVLPPAETTVKQRDVSGEAYVVFASGKTVVDPSFKDNAVELEKIHATIDSVKADADITITSVLLRGYSSPDGKYETNEKLALARTKAIKDYVSTLDSLDENLFVTEAVAENWNGLRAAVEAEDMVAKDKILEIIDGNLAPDKKEARIKANYPKQWKHLVDDVFPLLRRTDYHIGYTVRSYTTAEDARRIMRTQPDKLSITEFFLAAQGYEMGTKEFDEVFALAARVYPDNEVVNINAASASMIFGNLRSAENYLQRAGNSPEALYTKGILCALKKDWEGAVMYFTSAKSSGIKEADAALEVARQWLD